MVNPTNSPELGAGSPAAAPEPPVAPSPSPLPQGPLPLVVGVTGHRDLRPEDRTALEGQLRGIFRELRTRYPATPLLLLSSLAEGADRLAAHVALASGARLVVPLPLEAAEYERDFTTPESRAEFRELLGRAEQVLTLPLLPGNTAENVRAEGEPRNRQYTLAGAYVARHSQILIALWDGIVSGRTGGTAEIVGFKLRGVPYPYAPVQSPLTPPENGPVYQIVTPRLSNPHPAGTPLHLRKHFPRTYRSEAEAEAACNRIYKRMNTYNRDVLRLHAYLEANRRQSREWVLCTQDVEGLPGPLQELLERYATADSMAIHFQRYALWLLAALMVLVFVAAFFFNVSDVLPNRLWGRVAYAAVLAAAYGLHLWGQLGDYESKYLDYRALAEGLRVQFFWRLAGLPDLVADHYLHKQRSELDWIRQAVRIWTTPTLPEEDGRLPLVLKCWVKGQRSYFSRAAPRDEKRLRWWRLLGNACFFAGLAWAGAKLLFTKLQPHPIEAAGWDNLRATLVELVLVFISLAPVIAALLFSYAKTRGLSEHAKQYGRMGQLFAAAEERLLEFADLGKVADARAVIRELGKEALVENGDWVQLHRERPIQVPR